MPVQVWDAKKMPKMIEAMAMRGLNDKEIATVLGVLPETFSGWKPDHPEIAISLAKGRSEVDKVARAIHKRATGFSYVETTEVIAPACKRIELHPDPEDPTRLVEVEVEIPDTVTERKKTRKMIPPETAAAKYVLNNRDPDHWRESTHVDHTTNGKDIGTPAIDLSKLTDDEILTLARLEAKAKGEQIPE